MSNYLKTMNLERYWVIEDGVRLEISKLVTMYTLLAIESRL